MWLPRCAAALIAFAPSLALAAYPDCIDPAEQYPGSWFVDPASNVNARNACTTTTLGSFAERRQCAIDGAVTGSSYVGINTEYCYSGTTPCTSVYIQVKRADGIWPIVRITRQSATPDYCPPEPECGDGTQGRLQPTRAATADAVSTIIGGCLDGCEVSNVRVDPVGINEEGGTYYFLPWVTFSGETCGGGEPAIPPDDPGPDPEPAGEVCKTSTAGTEVCTDESYGENCGYVNDKFVCLGKTDTDECWVNDDGSRICGTNAPMPPVPDSGTPGQPATPTDTVAAEGPTGTTNEYNYYNSTVVAGSSRDPGDTGANPNRPDSTNPSTEPTPTTCVGDNCGTGTGDAYNPTTPALDELDSFGALTQAFWDGLQAAPIVSAWTNIGASVPTGSCPSYSLSVFGQTYSFTEFMCELWEEQVAPVLSLVFLFVWPFIGLRIVMSA